MSQFGGQVATSPTKDAVRSGSDQRSGLVIFGGLSDPPDGDRPWSEAVKHAVALASQRTGAVVLSSIDDANGLRIAVLLAGGGDSALSQAAAATARGWPLLVASGSGGAADRLAAARTTRRGVDAELTAIANGGHVDVVPVTDDAALIRRLVWVLHPDQVLKDAWALFATYDRVAVRLRRAFERFQISILLLGVLATLLALLHQELGTQPLRWGVIIASIAVGSLVALSGRRGTGKRWVVTRAAAESVKAEILRYRTCTGPYATWHLPGADPSHRPGLLAARLEKIQNKLVHGEAGSGALPPYVGPLPPDADATDDDGLQPLNADRYLELRAADQIRYYNRHLKVLERRRAALQGLAIVASGTGALVAAVGAETWVALTAAVAAAPLAYLAHLQVDNTIVADNQSVARLEGVLRRWHARPPAARTPQAFGELVAETEAVMTAEREEWVEQMTEALRDLQARHQKQDGPEQ